MTFAVGSGPPGGPGAGHQPFGISNVLSSLLSLYISPQTPPPLSVHLLSDFSIFPSVK